VFMCFCVIASWGHFFSLTWSTFITTSFCFAFLLPHHRLCAYFTYLLLACLLRTCFAYLLLVTCLLHLLITCCLFACCSLFAFASFACHAYFRLFTYFYHCHLLASMSWCRYQTPIPLFHHLFICFELQAFPLAWYFPFTCLCKRYNIGGVCINL
jgi:hypothetical protein